MVIALVLFAAIFLLRDAQALGLREHAGMSSRIAVYSALQLGAIALMAHLCEMWPGISSAWTDRRFALAALLVQLAEAAIAFALRKFATGRFCWVGWMLPSPVFLVALFGLSFAIGDGLLLSHAAAVQMATLSWLLLVFAVTIFLNRAGSASEDPNFTGDFALLTVCTALLFVPAGFF